MILKLNDFTFRFVIKEMSLCILNTFNVIALSYSIIPLPFFFIFANILLFLSNLPLPSRQEKKIDQYNIKKSIRPFSSIHYLYNMKYNTEINNPHFELNCEFEK